MRRKLLIATSLAMLLLLGPPPQVSHATPSPPYILVNEATRQCYVSIMNDECFWCDPPPGWKIYGPGNPSYGPTACPAGFTQIDELSLDCTRYKSRLCCGVFAAHGDCEDLVINATQQACGFVDDIRACVLPAGWSERPTDVPPAIWTCNFAKYRWVDHVSCLASTPTARVLSVREVAPPYPWALPAIGIGLVLLGGGMLAWLVRRSGRGF